MKQHVAGGSTQKAPKGFKAAYQRVAKDPAPPVILADILGLVGYDVAPEVIEGWALDRRVEAEVWAVREHAKASDNLVRRHPKPEWLPEPWLGEDRCLMLKGGTVIAS